MTITIPPVTEKAMFQCAVEILGAGYVDAYYEIIISELRWAYEAGYKAAVKDSK